MSKSVIITGVAGGMGAAAAKYFIDKGYEVFGLDRKMPKILKGPHYNKTGSFDPHFTKKGFNDPHFTETELHGLHFIETDLTDQEAVEEACRKVGNVTDKIFAIIHLAGIYDLNSLVEMTEEEFVKIFNVNLFAVYRINKTFLPLLEKGGRIVITTSELAPLDPLPFTGIYGITKTALEKYAYSLRMELQLLSQKVIVIRPGAVATGLLDVSTSRLDDFCRQTAYYSCNSERFRKIVDRVETRKIPPEKIAALIGKAVAAKNPRFVYNINRNPLLRLLNILPDRLQNFIIRKILTR